MVDTDHVEDFLSKKGSIEIFCVIGKTGARFNEIEEKVSISHDTVSNRLAEGQELNFFTPEAITGERGTTHEWRLQYAGSKVWERLDSENVVETFHQLVSYRTEFDNKLMSVEEWVKENSDNLGNEWQTSGIVKSSEGVYDSELNEGREADNN